MEQGHCLDSTRMSARQPASGVMRDESGLDAATTALLTRSAASPVAPSQSLPEPASQEAMALFKAACTETDRLDRDAVHGYPMLKRSGLEWWTKCSLNLALETGEVPPVEYARLYPFAAEREHRIDAAAITTNVAALQALAFASDYGRSTQNDADEDLQAAIARHRAADIALIDAAVAADPLRIRNEGGDTSALTMAPLEDAEDAADLEAAQSWRALFQVRPNTVMGLLLLLRHTAEHYEFKQDIDNPPDVFGALIGAVEGLRLAMLPRPAEHDLSLLSISELEHLARIANRKREEMLAVENQGFCWSESRESFSALGRIVEAEGERMAFLGEYAVHEIERRRPSDKDDINLRLETLVRHHLTCNGYIEPELMTEVVQAWGRA